MCSAPEQASTSLHYHANTIDCEESERRIDRMPVPGIRVCDVVDQRKNEDGGYERKRSGTPPPDHEEKTCKGKNGS